MNKPDYEYNWFEGAACSGMDPDVWFPEEKSGVHEARIVCVRCPVKKRCYQYAVDNHIHDGVWGGINFTKSKRQLSRKKAKELDLTDKCKGQLNGATVPVAVDRRDVPLSDHDPERPV